MKFLEELSLKNKLYFLFILITTAFITVSIITTINISNMKKKLDSLYFGSLVPVTELNKILQIYSNDLTSTVYKVKSSQINKFQATNSIDNSLKDIDAIWYKYEHHFKRDYELEYVEYVSTEIKDMNKYIKTIHNNYNKIPLNNISLEELKKKIFNINSVIQKLLHYEIEMARYERIHFLNIYDNLLFTIIIGLSFIISTVLFISYSIFNTIHKNQTYLEDTSEKLTQANKDLERASYTDSLTNLYNRRYFNNIYSIELKRAKRDNSFITFMMLDIDYFKQYNDTYGHLQGDEALKIVANTLKETLHRPSDFVFRLGGEEFGIILTKTDEFNSAKIALNICNAIKSKKIEHKNSKVNNFLTISIGVVCCNAKNLYDDKILLTLADDMLYEAKDNGRDKYVITSNIKQA